MARKILLADDSVTAQNMGRKILADAGYEVIAVNNGSAALKKIAELKPDLVILDVYMPGYSGLEVCQRLKESQETARIPVLLTVGKLEPFKPEEAQRVRAEGYIVKPFEASELLSALSKLEDKVVPRAEPSKPGRFARAMAVAEESGRGNRNEPSSNEIGWKSRISFPHQKTEAEQNASEEAQAGNQEAGRKAAGKKGKLHEASPAAETSVDVAALSPAGLPKDVTPEEVAAIAAAAAQMQIASAGVNDEHRLPSQISEPQSSELQASQPQISHPQVSGSEVSEATSRANLEAYLDKVEDGATESAVGHDFAATARGETKIEGWAERDEPGKIDSSAGDFAPVEAERRDDAEKAETQDLPVTMAATAESVAGTGRSRWTAVSVALESEEATTSLEHEMQKAYAAFAAADYVSDSNSFGPTSAPAQVSAELPEAKAETTASAISNPGHEMVGEVQPEAIPAPLSVTPEPQKVAQESASTETYGTQAESANRDGDPSPVGEPGSPIRDNEATDSLPAEAHVVQESERGLAEAATASTSAFEPIPREPEPKVDSETVKSTAAAWASWRQIRDSNNGGEMAQDRPKEMEVPESTPADLNAKAVAAGAEQIVQQTYSDAPAEKPADVASIVDSVLADLRPKLMEEITRKMAEKK